MNPSQILERAMGLGAGLLKLLYYAIFAAILGFVIWKYRKEFRDAIRRLIEDLRAWWVKWNGRSPQEQQIIQEATVDKTPPPRPFADFANPFQSGLASQLSVEELIRYSFDALEAWGRERGCERQPQQTPLEFAQVIGRQVDSMHQNARNLAELYSRLSYARGSLPPTSVEHVKRMWGQLSSAT